VSQNEDAGTRRRFERLNRVFYLSRPHQFFRAQMETLIRVSAAELLNPIGADDLEPIMGDMSFVGVDASDEMWSSQQYVDVEAQLLLHRSSESVLRLYLAHLGIPPCPWLEIANLKNPRAFKDAVDEEILDADSEALRRNVMIVVTGYGDRPDGVARWEEGLNSLVEFLKTLAAVHLNDGALYNSLKHGFSTAVGNGALTIGEDGADDVVELDSGTVFQYLEHDAWGDDNTRVWKETSYWTSTRYALRLTHVACCLIENIWQIGRLRYGQSSENVELFFPEELTVWDLKQRDPSSFTKLSVSVAKQVR
jgi:hypothetical protein